MPAIATLVLASLLHTVADTGPANPPPEFYVPPSERRYGAPISVAREPIPIIMLGDFWGVIRRASSPNEAIIRVRQRFGNGPWVFQGIGPGPEYRPTRVTITDLYRREGDETIDLPAVTADVVESVQGFNRPPRRITIPLASGF